MLRIVGRRPDGYHQLQTVFQFIDKCDWVTLRLRDDGRIVHLNPLPGVPEAEDLTIRAAKLIRAEAGAPNIGIDIQIEKNLPMGGGIGGGSSDAATTLVGLNLLWNLNLPIPRLADLGLRLGADVPVFIWGQAAWGEGVGERLVSLTDLDEPWYVIIVPPCHVSTAEVFASTDLTRDTKPIRIADFLAGDQVNDCLPVVSVLYPPVKAAIVALGEFSERARLTGTGGCVFADFASRKEADAVAEKLSVDWEVFVAKGVNRSPIYGDLGLSKNS